MGDSTERVYYQLDGSSKTWHECPVRFIENIRREKRPAFFTVLSVSEPVNEDTDLAKLKYKGPFYLDFDGSDIDFVIEKVQQLLHRLEDEGCNVNSFGLFATGGKGFHVIIPPATFMEKPNRDGIIHLPSIYREMAHKISVDTLDFRVYSARRGRMWREPNVKRENGRYKVPISWAELQQMDADKYVELTSAPRRYASPEEYSSADPLNVLSPEQAEPNMFLSMLFDEATIAVRKALERRAKSSKKDSTILKKWGGKPPPSFQQMLNGVGIKPGSSFNDVCLQLCILASELGWDVDRLEKEAQGFIENHKGDSNRYRSLSARIDELRGKFSYIQDNICYSFAAAPVKALLTFDTPDLDGLVGEEVVEEVQRAAAAEPAEEKDDDRLREEIEMDDISSAIEIRPSGIYIETEDGRKRISSLHLKNFTALRDIGHDRFRRFEAIVVADGMSHGLCNETLEVFQSKPAIVKFTNHYGTVFNGTEAHAQAYWRKLIMAAQKRVDDAKIVYMVNKEGLDLVCMPKEENPLLRKKFPIWADSSHVVLPKEIQDTGVEMRFTGLNSPSGNFKTDLMMADDIMNYKDDPVAIEALRALMTCQTPHTLAKLLGWYCAVFYRPFMHEAYQKFPLLHVNGTAGAGKSEMNTLMNSFFYVNQEPKILTPGSSAFAIRQHMVSSASIPLIIDEYKPSDMRRDMQGMLEGALKAAYNNASVSQGGGNQESASFRAVQDENYCAPCVFIGEQLTTLTALIERSVIVNLIKPNSTQQPVWGKRLDKIRANAHVLSALGKYMAIRVCGTSIEAIKQAFEPMEEESMTQVNYNGDRDRNQSNGLNPRIVYNYAVAKLGLTSFSRALEEVFGKETFESELKMLHDSLFIDTSTKLAESKAEVMKVLDVMSVITRQYDPLDSRSLVHDREYAYTTRNGIPVMELEVNMAFFKYLQYCQTCSSKPLFNSPNGFKHALMNHSAFVSAATEVLPQSSGCVVLNTALLEEGGAEPFKH